ncbi:MAG: hypothetical protein EBU90_21410 [Proteobacteria bacterium]|nr:hypothetical protein [Pseudomonadota bacterium]
MNKYNSEDYFTVRERRTHKKICDCGNLEDAKMVMSLDIPNREVVKNKSLMSPVIDVEIPKALPTNEIVVNMDGGVGGSWEVREPEKLPQIKLPEGQGIPVNAK